MHLGGREISWYCRLCNPWITQYITEYCLQAIFFLLCEELICTQ